MDEDDDDDGNNNNDDDGFIVHDNVKMHHTGRHGGGVGRSGMYKALAQSNKHMLYLGTYDGRVLGLQTSVLAHSVLRFVQANERRVALELAHARGIVQRSSKAATKACKSVIRAERLRLVK
uniref:Unconventional myosin-VIIb n=1 Tax=Lygus hesperus TaxID=30085 RepID=A0A0A9WII9_LYGHE